MSDHQDPDLLDADDALEEIDAAADVDQPMDSGDEAEEITLQNDSVAHFDQHRHSIFAIAQHPIRPTIVATGGSEGEDDDAPGMGYVFDTGAAPERPVLPASYNADGAQERAAPTTLEALFRLEGHTDSITALAWGLPRGEVLFSGGMDGRLRAYTVDLASAPARLALLAEAREVREINWLTACPAAEYANAVALGADDGSVWVYAADPAAGADGALSIVQSYFLHTDTCTAGAWTPDGKLLVTVAQDGSLYAWDVWGKARARGLVGENGTTAVGLTLADQRFAVEGGLYSVAIEPRGTYVAVGGAGGAIRVVSLPSLSTAAGAPPSKPGKAKAGKASAGKTSAGGQILAALQVQTDSIESLSFSAVAQGATGTTTTTTMPTATLLAAGSVDGSIVAYDPSRQFAARRNMQGAHGGLSVVKVEFVPGAWALTSCGIDGVVRRWDLRGAAEAGGLVGEWRGHRGGSEEEGGGVMGFVQGMMGKRIVTAGDDGLALVFDA